MIIVDPVTLNDTSFSGGPGTLYDKNGTLQTSVAGVPRVTYDASDLSKAPYVLAEAAATNLLTYSEDVSNAAWGGGGGNLIANAIAAPDGMTTADKLTSSSGDAYLTHAVGTVSAGASYTFSVWLRTVTGTLATKLSVSTSGGDSASSDIAVTASWRRFSTTLNAAAAGSATIQIGGGATITSGMDLCVWGAQFEAGSAATSYIPTTGAAANRPADTFGTTAGVLYSNVAENEYPAYAAGSYAAGARVIQNHTVYESKVDANTVAPTDATKWLPIGATNQRAMFDAYNNTQTSNAEEIVVVVSPRAICQGLYLGNLDASEVRVSMVDQTRGLVYSETQSLLVSSSKSSFFRWCFNRIQRKTYFLTLKLPVFASPLITITIRKPGGTAKCGMCMVGPAIDIGLSLMGLATEIKDYSSTTFNVDGTSSTIVRNYAKRMSVDISIDNDQIYSVQERLANYRQKNVVWVGATMYGSAMVCGKYSSFKNVIESFTRSKMALQIEGVV